jgi:hypothetical protein
VEHEGPEYWLTLTPMQCAKFGDWTEAAAPRPFIQMPLAEQPAGLTIAALEATQGGAFYPSIEITSIVRHRGAAAFGLGR